MFVSGRSPPPEPLTQSKTWCQSTDRRVLWCILRSGNAGAHSTPNICSDLVGVQSGCDSARTNGLFAVMRTSDLLDDDWPDAFGDAFGVGRRMALAGTLDGWEPGLIMVGPRKRADVAAGCQFYNLIFLLTFRRNGNLFSNHRVLIVFNLTRQRI